MIRSLLTVAFVGLAIQVASAQTLTSSDFSRASNAAYFNYTRPGDVSVMVNIWGTIRHTGRYELTRGSDLGDAISLAGGPSDTGQRTDEYDRVITVTLSRQGMNGREVIFQSELSQIVESKSSLPTLLDNDVVYVNTYSKGKPSFRNVYLPIMNFVATGLLITLRIVDISNRN